MKTAFAEVQDAAENPRAVIGGNLPPPTETLKEINELLPGYLESVNADLVKRADDLESAFARVPDAIDNEELAGKVSDFVAQITACVKEAEAKRTDLVAGAIKFQRTSNTFYDKRIFDRLDTPKGQSGIKQKLLGLLTGWERLKADQERRRREEAERIAREEAARAERERQEIERKARVAADAERKAREAAEAEARRKADEEAAKIKNKRQLEEAIKREEERRIAAAKEAAEAEIRAAQREAAIKQAAEDEARAQGEADKAAAAAAENAASMHTVRGDYGSSSSLRTTTKGFIKDRNELLKSAADIWPFLSDEVLDKAVNTFVKINKNSRTLHGVDIREVTSAVVRG